VDEEPERHPQQATADAELEEAVRRAAAEREEPERAPNPDTGIPGEEAVREARHKLERADEVVGGGSSARGVSHEGEQR
jgi:hypothetical protein